MKFCLNTKKISDYIFFPLLILFGLALYGFILKAPFQLDDHELLLGSSLVRSFDALLQNLSVRKIITFFTFAVNYRFGGEGPLWYHAVNLALHISSGILFYKTLLKIFESPFLKRRPAPIDARTFAFFSALIFLVHPLQTESVTYIWQRTELVSAFLYLLGYFLYLKARIEGKRLFLILGIFVFACGLLEKGTIITLPILVLLTEWMFFENQQSRKILKAILISAVIFGVLLILPLPGLQKALNKLNILLMTLTNIHLSYEYTVTEFGVLLRYLTLTFIPWGQNVEHDVRLASSFFHPQVYGPFLVLVFMFVLAVRNFNRHRLAVFGVLWYFIYLLPTCLIYREPMWEHRLYLSLAGFGVFVSAVSWMWIKNDKYRMGFLCAVILIFSSLTVARNILWLSPQALLEDAVKKSPKKARPHQQLGVVYLEQKRFDEAALLFQKAIRLDPEIAEAYNNLGVIFMQRGLRPEAEAFFKKALRLRPGFASAYYNLGELSVRGFFADYEQGKMYFEQVLQQKPHHTGALLSLAEIYRMEGDYVKSLDFCQKAGNAGAPHAETYIQSGLTYEAMNNFPKAKEAYLQAHRLTPDDPRAMEFLIRLVSP